MLFAISFLFTAYVWWQAINISYITKFVCGIEPIFYTLVTIGSALVFLSFKLGKDAAAEWRTAY